MNNNARMTCLIVVALAAALATVFMILCTYPLAAQGNPPKYEVDPSWPRPLPNKWVTGAVSGVCTDAQDHVFIANRGNLTENELDSGRQAPPVIEFDPQGNVRNTHTMVANSCSRSGRRALQIRRTGPSKAQL